MYVVNAFVVVWVTVVGFGFGGWASMTHFIKQVDSFGLFAKCYQCPPKISGSNHTMHHWKSCSFVWLAISISPFVWCELYFPYNLLFLFNLHIDTLLLMLVFPSVARQYCYFDFESFWVNHKHAIANIRIDVLQLTGSDLN